MKTNTIKVVSKEDSKGSAREMFLSPFSAEKVTEGDVTEAVDDALTQIKNAEISSINQINNYKDSAISLIEDEVVGSKNELNQTVDSRIQEIKTIPGVIKNENGNLLKFWTGTQAEYDALGTKSEDTMYMIKGV